MSKTSNFITSALVVAILSGIGCYWAHESFSSVVIGDEPARPEVSDGDQEPIRPIAAATELNPDKVNLGDRLFHDRRLSGNDTISCAHCHDLGNGGADHRVRSLGLDSQMGEANAPTVFNSSLNFKQFWDGRAATLEEQIDGPIRNPKEMNSSWPAILAKLRAEESYASPFARLYAEGIQNHTVKDAIATFERSLLTPNSRFDRYLRGETNAIDDEEKEGYQLFKSYGCVSCHQGVGIGGNMYATFGAMADYFPNRQQATHVDLGRFNVTGKEIDRYRFKVPSLRNVALTAPYFHDGSAPTLKSAVSVMAKYQLGRQIREEDTERIVQFLHTLTGEYKGALLK